MHIRSRRNGDPLREALLAPLGIDHPDLRRDRLSSPNWDGREALKANLIDR
jgi:hypothetical protein